jgi:hypothetical protein
MNTKLFTGNGASNAITSVGFQPDWTWFKSRSGTNPSVLFDVVRDVTKGIYSNLTNAEDTLANSLSSFDSDGFTLGADTGSGGSVNGNTNSMASWNWKAGGAGVANAGGSISSTVSANTTAGFSIVKYTGTGVAGATVGHGLGVTPKMIITKQLTSASSWGLYHVKTGNNVGLIINETGAGNSGIGYWNDTSPTSSVFSIGTDGVCNAVGEDFIAYCFAEVQGYSKMGSYIGAGTDFPYIYTGFKPEFIMIKQAVGADNTNWSITDNSRLGYNSSNRILYPNSSQVEDSYDAVDHFSNGFKLTSSTAGYNSPSDTYIYYAVGQSMVGINDVPATAR